MRFSLALVAAPAAACMVLLFPATTINAGHPTMTATPPSSEAMIQRVRALPLAFTENRGQWDKRVRFRASGGGATLWFCRDGITYQFVHRIPRAKSSGRVPIAAGNIPGRPFEGAEPDSIETVVVHAAFVGADPTAEPVGEGPLEYRCNYFLGNDPAKWRTDVPNYTTVVYQNVYPGVDVRYEGKGGALTCSYSAASESDLTHVKFRYDGNVSVTETGHGQFRLETPWGAVLEPMSSGRAGAIPWHAVPVEASTLAANGAASVALVYSTYLGGGDADVGEGIAVDGDGDAVVTGYTYSTNFPIVGPYQTDLDSYDAFVTKLNVVGNALVYSTYLGGELGDNGHSVTVDWSGNAYVTGYTHSDDFPTVGPYQMHQGGQDAFVIKLNAAGDSLVYSTYLGGTLDDDSHGIAVDGSGNAYVTGRTISMDFPTVNPYQTDQDSADVFVTKLNAAGSSLVYSTYLGGGDDESGNSIAVDESASAYVTGSTYSNDFPTRGPYQTDRSNYDAFVTKLSPAGNDLVYSTYLGGSWWDYGYGIAVDGSGNAYVTGVTYSTDFPTVGPFQTDQPGFDAFVTKLNAAGDGLVYSTYLGGTGDEWGVGVAVNESGNAYVTGDVSAYDFPTVDPCQPYMGNFDAFLTILGTAGNTLEYSTYLGGISEDYGRSVAVDGSGNAYVTGYNLYGDFPTVGPYQMPQGGSDAFVAKFVLRCNCQKQGDLDSSGFIDAVDVLKVIQIVFVKGTDIKDPSCPRTRGDMNVNGVVDVNDVLYIIKTAFTNGPAPVNPCGP